MEELKRITDQDATEQKEQEKEVGLGGAPTAWMRDKIEGLGEIRIWERMRARRGSTGWIQKQIFRKVKCGLNEGRKDYCFGWGMI